MNGYGRVFVIVASVMTLALTTGAVGQDGVTERPIESRILALEQTVSRLSIQLLQRTEVTGPQDRMTRDLNLENRLRQIEQSVQQLSVELAALNRQLSSVATTASQAQRDAQMARDAAMRR